MFFHWLLWQIEVSGLRGYEINPVTFQLLCDLICSEWLFK